MNIDFPPPSKGTYNNAGSSRQLANYLEHEDLERMEKGIYTEGFFNLTEENFYKSQVVKDIDKMNPLSITIEGKLYRWDNQYITGTELKQQAGIPLDAELYLAICKPFDHELIENLTRVNLARPGIEQFFVKKKLNYFINEKEYVSYKQWISGAELRIVGNVPENEDIYLLVDEGWENDHILNDELVDLARPGKERFITKVKPGNFVIYVNGREHLWNKMKISFEEVLSLYTTNVNCECTAYTVKYTKGPVENTEGSMVEGDIVYVKSKMNFNVATTNRS